MGRTLTIPESIIYRKFAEFCYEIFRTFRLNGSDVKRRLNLSDAFFTRLDLFKLPRQNAYVCLFTPSDIFYASFITTHRCIPGEREAKENRIEKRGINKKPF